MKSILFFLPVALLSAIHPAAAQETDDDGALPLTAAILDFKDGSNDLEGTGASVSAILQAKLSAVSEVSFVERAELGEILGEQELALSEAVTAGQAAQVGQLTGAEALVSGRVFPVKDRVYVVAKVISASTGRVFGATSDYPQDGELDDAIDELAEKVGEILSAKSEDLRGGESVADRQHRTIKAKMKDKQGPNVHVAVEEQIIRNPIIDPAVQTELQRTLQLAGWTVVEKESDADIVVSGEAIAETGSRRGNLWFTRARLEFTVKDKDGKVLKVDRLTSGNVDLTEALSGKGALQKTGLIASGIVVDAWLAPAP